ncbi:hypothetical protein ABEV54_05785 [Peribacillus psychrosaccharolyticus]|uniref:hypothetical protein n=1 Tax=Peribacillus psychrosaccharolyticus TaxID=1407 RepID=UPI003D26C900
MTEENIFSSIDNIIQTLCRCEEKVTEIKIMGCIHREKHQDELNIQLDIYRGFLYDNQLYDRYYEYYERNFISNSELEDFEKQLENQIEIYGLNKEMLGLEKEENVWN